MEALRLRVKDLDFEMKQLTVRDGKGGLGRYTMLAESVIPALREHLARVQLVHAQDLRRGNGALPRRPKVRLGQAGATGCRGHHRHRHSKENARRVISIA